MSSSWAKHSSLAFVILSYSLLASGQDTLLDLYKSAQGYGCFRLMNKDGVIGCQTPRDGTSGALWPLGTDQEIDEWTKKPPSDKKMLLLQNAIFTKENVARLIKTGKVAGILLPSDLNGPAEGFSPAEKYPNKRFGIHSEVDYTWNPWGNSWDFEQYNIPIWSLNGRIPYPNSSSENITAKAKENKDRKGAWPQYAVSVESFMSAGTDSATCLRRGRCDPVGGKSIWSAFEPIDPNKEIILAITQLDANAFFHDLAVGADAAVSGTIALMLAAKQLQYAVQNKYLDKQLVFAFFTGEAWGYVGSKRFVKDLTAFTCKKQTDDGCSDPPAPTLAFQNIKLDKITAIIELNQVGQLPITTGNRSQVYIHWEKTNQAKGQTDLMNALHAVGTKYANGVELRFASLDTPGIPPSSLMSFVANNPLQAGVVLTEFDRNYTNPYYGSRFDRKINLPSLCRAATVLSQTMYQLARNSSAPDVDFSQQINCTSDSLAGVLRYCLVNDIGCPLARSYFNAQNKYYDVQPSAYAGVFRANSVISDTALFVYYALSNIMGTQLPLSCTTPKDCGGEGRCVAGTCFSAQTYWHNAVSLAFEPKSDNSYEIVKEHWQTDATWTESRWNTPVLRVFKKDNPVTEILVFVFGFLEVVASFAVVWFLRRYFDRRFKPS